MEPPSGTVLSATVDERGHLILPGEFAHNGTLEPGSEIPMRMTRNGMLVRPPLSQLRKVYVEPTSCCNLSCRTCMRNSWGEPMGHMAAGTFDRVLAGITDQEPRPTVFFGGFGEPLMHPDIVGMVKRAADVASHVELITNGILLDSHLAAELIQAGLGTLWVSLDGASPESYADVRMSNSLSSVLQNILRYREQHRTLRGGDPDVGVVFVAMKRNIEDLPALIRQSIRLGISRYMVTNILPYTPEMCEEVLYHRSVDRWGSRPSPWNPSINMPHIDINAVTREALLRMQTPQPGGATDRYDCCPFIEQRSISVAWDGNVSPCLALLHSHLSYLFDLPRAVRHHRFGNVDDRPLMEIWRSREYAEFRRKVEEFDFAPCTVCASCEMAEANQEDCFGNSFPTCGGCLWARGVIQCP